MSGSFVHLFYPSTFSDIIINGSSASALGIVEAKVWDDGWGYILVEKTTETDTKNTWVDGQTQLHILWGNVQIVDLQE